MNDVRERIVALARSLFERGFASGSAGNLSARLSDGRLLVTPTNSCLGRLDPERLSVVGPDGALLSGDPPSKETPFHRAVYASRPDAGAVVHLHSPGAAAVACLADLNPEDVLPHLTPYYRMRIGRLPLVPYHPPGAPELAAAVGEAARHAHAMLLANHGPVVAGPDLETAVNAAEELEEAARLFLATAGRRIRLLSPSPRPELAVLVTFRLKAAHVAPFREAMMRQATASLEREPGCRRFDVCLDPEDERKVFLYELYDDDAAFEAHLRTDHFLGFDATVRDWIEDKRVERRRLAR